jgi:starch phosphorylase
LENEVIATYYQEPKKWLEIVKNGMKEVVPFFDADRMATEYYDRLYNYVYQDSKRANTVVGLN